ncbi:DUF6221 family protein [Planotetraspora mira]|uniref:Uncharacterized protein n=1 Tax=Planotetraspora mira TaxID=58121 RepID=A0A8J3TYP1_9ACTN|nr:DUF6221 family protein [Planotetraspora mira]GII34321.1 hypothetical protein Pmi06nite_77630 [Planotetraspora mira]
MSALDQWLRATIEVTLRDAQNAGKSVGPVWDNPSIGDLRTSGGELYQLGDRNVAIHMAANDPHETIARCEAELAILDAHAIVQVSGIGEDMRATQVPACRTCSHKHGVPCRTVRLLSSGYRHRDGYDDDWSPP